MKTITNGNLCAHTCRMVSSIECRAAFCFPHPKHRQLDHLGRSHLGPPGLAEVAVPEETKSVLTVLFG